MCKLPELYEMSSGGVPKLRHTRFGLVKLEILRLLMVVAGKVPT